MPDEGASAGLLGRDLRATTVSLVLSVGLVAFDELGVTTALPRIAVELGGLATYGWALSVLVLATVIGTALGGRVADRRGPAVPSAVGFAVFGLGVIVSGLAGDWSGFLAGRLIQGLGAGAVVGMVYVIVTVRYPLDLRARGLALISAAWMVPALVGPTLSGLLTETVGWRTVFALLLALTLVAGSISAVVSRGVGDEPGGERSGAVATTVWACVLALGVGGFLAGLEVGGPGAALGVAGLVLAGVALRRLTPVGTLRARPGLPAGLVARALLAAAFFGVSAFLTLLLVELRGAGPTLAGAVLSVGSLAWSAGAGLQARDERRHGSDRRPRQVVVGCLVLVLGLTLVTVALLTTSWPAAVVAPGWAVAGLGMGGTNNVTTAATFDHATERTYGRTSAGLQITQTLGISLAAGAGTSLLAVGGPDPRVGAALVCGAAIVCAALALPASRRIFAGQAPTEAAAAPTST